jgi:hypothetical protein
LPDPVSTRAVRPFEWIRNVLTLVRRAGFEIAWLKTLPAGRGTVRWLVRLLRWLGKARVRDDHLGEITYIFARKVRTVDPASMSKDERYPPPVYLFE